MQDRGSLPSVLVKSFVIEYDELQMDKELGSGSFGVVYTAEWRNQRVAGKITYFCLFLILQVKKMKGNFSGTEVEKFKDEANLLSNLRPHSKIFTYLCVLFFLENVVLFLGLCLDPLCIGNKHRKINIFSVVEFYKNGSLLDYLRDSKPLSEEARINILKGIAAGMVHLHKVSDNPSICIYHNRKTLYTAIWPLETFW